MIRLIGLLAFAGTTNICIGAESGTPASDKSGRSVSSPPTYTSGPIQNPLDPQAYLADLASRMHSSDGKSLLMKGMVTPKIRKADPPRTDTLPSKPAAPSGVGASCAVNAAKTPDATPSQAKPQTQKSVPAAEVPTMMVWNGLSPDNRAAQRAMEHLQASRATQASLTARVVEAARADAAPMVLTAQATGGGQTAREVSPLNQALMSAQPGLTLWTTPTPANLAEKIDIDPSVALKDPNAAGADPSGVDASKPWSLGTDLDKYRAHAVKEGSRDSTESLKKALERAGLAIGDGVNVFILGYGSDRAKAFRINDGKGLLDEPGNVPRRAGATAISFADGMYSLADLIAFDSLPDPIKDVYKDNNPLVRPLIFTGRTIGGVWKTTEEVGNALTWGYFDNVTGCVGIVIEDIMELLKHVGQAATNLVRAPVQLVAGKKEPVERTLDWILLVPLEFATNSAQMKGFSNMDDYKTAFEDKGVIGSVLELGGSTFLAYRMVDELVDELKKDKHRRSSTTSEPETPTDPPGDTIVQATGSEMLFLVEGEWPNMISEGGIIYFDGPFPTVTVYIE